MTVTVLEGSEVLEGDKTKKKMQENGACSRQLYSDFG